jgi:hypothetical protein
MMLQKFSDTLDAPFALDRVLEAETVGESVIRARAAIERALTRQVDPSISEAFKYLKVSF